MKRYTLQFRSLDASISASDLRREFEQVLLSLHPRITYRIGQVYKDIYGEFNAEIAMDGERQLLTEALKRKQWSLPIVFERPRWGWFSDNAEASLMNLVTNPLNSDPLSGVPPLEGTQEYSFAKRYLRGRYIFLMVSTLGLLLVLIANTFNTRSPFLEWMYLAFFIIFMFSLINTPIDIRVYAEKITLKLDRLEVSFWLLTKPVSLAWETIWGIDYADPVCTLQSQSGKTRFLLSERFGCKDKSTILKTIIARAGLYYVEGNVQSVMYRKPDSL